MATLIQRFEWIQEFILQEVKGKVNLSKKLDTDYTVHSHVVKQWVCSECGSSIGVWHLGVALWSLKSLCKKTTT